MSASPNILLIDDDELVRQVAGDLLRQEFPDAKICEVGSLNGLRQALEAGGFNVVVTDYQLGWTDGLAILREVKRRYPDCPVVMFTGTGSEEIAVAAMKAGLDDYVLKSSSEHVVRLTASVRAVLAQAEERRVARDTEARYRSLINDVLDTSAVGLFILDASFKVVWINEAMERYFGIRRADVIGQDKRRLIQERIKQLFDRPDEFAANILQSYERNDQELRFECHMPGAGGREERWLEHRSLPIRTGLYAGGRSEHYYDITGQKRSEATLREHEQQLLLFTLATNDLFWNFDMVSEVLTRSTGFTRAFGYTAEEMAPNLQWWEDRLHPDDRERVLAIYRDALAGGATTCAYEYRFRRQDNSYAVISDRAYIVRDKTGKPVRSLGAMTDITELKRSEDHLREANETLSSLIQASPMAITMLDAKGTVRVWNPSAERVFGWSSDEVLGSPLPTVPEERLDAQRRICEQVLLDEVFTGLEVVRRRKDGLPVTISLSTAPLRNAKGRIVGIMEIMADITERKQMEQHAGRIERLAALGQLLGGIAHEIKNPLFVLAGRLQLLKEKLTARNYDALPSDVNKIEEAAKRIAHVSERFLTLAKPVRPQQTQCDLRVILNETLLFLSNELMKNQIQLVTELPPDLPTIRSDPRQLQELFLNLLLNAKQAMAEAHGKGMLTVKAELSAVSAQPSASEEKPSTPAERWIEVRIQDDGPGILPEHRAKLFEPFFSTKPEGEGTGLGLWTVRTIVMALGGAVTCESEVGRGATFIVRLPVSEEPLTIAKN